MTIAWFAAACGGAATPETPTEAAGQDVAQAQTEVNQTLAAAQLASTPEATSTEHSEMENMAAGTPGEAEDVLPGDPVNGQRLFDEAQPEAGFACGTCHRVDSEERLIVPGLQGVKVHAGNHVPGQGAEEYLRNSIVNPSAFVEGSYPDMLMPRNYSQIFTEQEIDDLVAYLFTL